MELNRRAAETQRSEPRISFLSSAPPRLCGEFTPHDSPASLRALRALRGESLPAGTRVAPLSLPVAWLRPRKRRTHHVRPRNDASRRRSRLGVSRLALWRWIRPGDPGLHRAEDVRPLTRLVH